MIQLNVLYIFIGCLNFKEKFPNVYHELVYKYIKITKGTERTVRTLINKLPTTIYNKFQPYLNFFQVNF